MTDLRPMDRYVGAATGAFIGDALAMPAHWYYDRAAISRDYGTIDTYKAPRRLHPESVLARSDYRADAEEADILGEDLVYWGSQNVHYHQHLRPGENTLNLKLLRASLHQVFSRNGYDRHGSVEAYIQLMRRPSDHRDTYVESCHREFFRNLRGGKPASDCAADDRHIGGLVSVVPMYAALRALGWSDSDSREATQAHVAITHGGALVAEATSTLLTIGTEVFEGGTLRDSIDSHALRGDLPYLGTPVAKLSSRSDDQVIGPLYSSSCDLPESMPATFYFARKYSESVRRGLVSNVMVGGDNCHRGAVMGALIGLSRGVSAFPQSWQEGLTGTVPGRHTEEAIE